MIRRTVKMRQENLGNYICFSIHRWGVGAIREAMTYVSKFDSGLSLFAVYVILLFIYYSLVTNKNRINR